MAKKHIISAGCLLASVLIAGSTVFFPSVALLSVFASAMFFAFAVITSPFLWVIWGGTALTFIVAMIFSGSVSWSMLFLLIFLPVGLSLGLGFRTEKGFNGTMALVALSSALLGALTLLLFIGEFSQWSFDAKDALTPVFQEFKAQILSAFTVETAPINALFESNGLSPEQYVNAIYLAVVYNIPTFYIGFMLCLALVGYWVMKAIMIRTQVPVSFMGRFDGFRVSYTGALIYFISSIIMLFASNSVFGIALSNFSNIMTYVFAYAGISLIAYFLDFKNFSPFFKGAILIVAFAICLVPTGLLNIISLLGVIDAYWNIREKLNNSGI